MNVITLETIDVKDPTFGDVQIHQFFEDLQGCIGQKISASAYHLIAFHYGGIASYYREINPRTPIGAVCKHVDKIEVKK